MQSSGGMIFTGHTEGRQVDKNYHEESIGASIYALLIKNVSKNQPLTAEEAQELKAFRSTLSTEQWQGWLQFARDEKQKLRAKRTSPPNSSVLTKDPEELLRAILKAEGTTHMVNGETGSLADSSDHIQVSEVAWNEDHLIKNVEQPHRDHDEDVEVPRLQKSKRLTAPTAVNQQSIPIAESTPKRTDSSKWQFKQEDMHQQTHQPQYPSRSFPPYSENPRESSVRAITERRSDGGNGTGVSLELGMIRRSSRGRASSAPRDRPAPSVNFDSNAYSNNTPKFAGTGYYNGPLPTYKTSPTHSPKLKHSRPDDFFGGSVSAVQGHSKDRGSSHGYVGTPAGPFSSRVSKQHQLESPVLASLDLADAAEIARSTAFRLDSAYSAAQCLLSTFVADQNQNYLATGGSNAHHHNFRHPEQNKASATLSILSEMMSSMEKSKVALSQLSNLHVRSSQPYNDKLRNYESTKHNHKQRLDSNSRHLNDDTRDPWVSPGGDRQQNQQRRRKSHSSSASNSPNSEEKGERDGDFYDSSPFKELDRDEDRSNNQVLNFEDLAQMTLSEQRARREGSNSFREAKWFPDSGSVSAGATLNAQFAQEKPSADFSPWNRQLAASASQEPLDPVNNLQAQLFSAADTNRKITSYAHSIGASPVPRAELQSQQFSYNRAGYVWEGVRFNRAQGPVARLCLAQGPLIKAHDDYPIRVDAESGVVDVVWREARHGDGAVAEGLLASSMRSNPSPIAKLLASETKQNYFTDSSASAKRNTVLRRERFSFDDVFTGLTAQGRLAFFTRQRARKALETAHNLVFLCLGCGDNTPSNGTAIEPPVSVLLGGGGGTGLISSVVDEIFRFTKPLTTNMQESKGLYPGSFPTASPSAFVASKLAFEQVKTRVTLSAIILTEQGNVFDLLGGSEDGAASLKRRKSDGRVMLCNASRLQLQASADFDRIMGLLLGKRTALHGVLQSLQMQRAQQLKQGTIPAEPLHNVLASIDPWASLNNLQPALDGNYASSPSSSMLITVSVSGGAVTSNQTSVDFNFVSPCGKDWSFPGADINILAELVSSLPNTPPPSLLRASALGMLLMDPRNPPSDFINVVTVHREDEAKRVAAKSTVREISSSVVEGALHSLRIIAQLTL